MRPVFLFNRPSLLLCLSTGTLWLGCEQAIAAAPVTPSGLNTQVSGPIVTERPNPDDQYDITGGTRPDGGANLFHSFGDFNVPNNNIANFLNDSGLATSNILGRVTGREYLEHLWHDSNHWLRERQPLSHEPDRILVRAERHGECRRDGGLHEQRIICDSPMARVSMQFRTQRQTRC